LFAPNRLTCGVACEVEVPPPPPPPGAVPLTVPPPPRADNPLAVEATKDEKYPVVFVTPTSDTEALNTNQFTVDIYCVDIIQADRANLNSIISDCQLILKDMYVYYTNDNDVEIDVVGTASMNPLNNQDLDYVAGWVMSITFEVASYGSCAIPMNPINPNPSPGCADAIQIITNTEGTELYVNTIPSGATETQEIRDSGATLRDTAENFISQTLIPAEIHVDLTAPDALLHIKKENDGTITNLSLLSNSSTEYIINNNDISVNGTLQFDIHATEALDIRLRDASNNVITPISVTDSGNHATIVLPTAAAPVGATLMKTGQTTSYRTGDDGDIEAGRATSFLVLASANPFGNTNRFTDELGGSTYTNNIVIDWSTYNGSTVLGYRRTLNGSNVTWNNAIDGSLAVSIGTFTTGWRLPNINEITNIDNFGVNQISFKNYSPFNISNGTLWSSTTLIASTTLAYLGQAYGTYTYSGKGGANGQYFPCRTFTVTGTTLT